jgi:hypothetical protein
MVRDPQNGKYRRTRLFVMTLGYSRKSVRFLVFRSSTRTWAELHEQAFRRLGGSCRIVVLDNLREGVLTPDLYEPTLNPLSRTFWRTTAWWPCRAASAIRIAKGRWNLESDTRKKTPLKGLRFETLDAAQAYLDQWELRWADTRIHGTTKRQVAVMFAEEKPALLPLPIEPFRYYEFSKRTVYLDGCVEVASAYYGLPPEGWIGQSVDVQWDQLHVRIINPTTHKLMREHIRQKPGLHRIRVEDNPKKTPLSTIQLLARAARAGSHIGALCEAIHRHQAELGVRRILGVLALARKYGVTAVNDACGAALELEIHEYRFVRRYLERQPQLTLRQVDPLIRELIQYRDLIDFKTKENPHEHD